MRARLPYQARVTGTPSGQGYVVDGVKFDGYADGVLLDAKKNGLIAEIKAADWYPKEYKTDTALDQAINAILAKTPDLKRCMRVEYTVMTTEATPPTPAGQAFSTAIGPDVWLLLEKK